MRIRLTRQRTDKQQIGGGRDKQHQHTEQYAALQRSDVSSRHTTISSKPATIRHLMNTNQETRFEQVKLLILFLFLLQHILFVVAATKPFAHGNNPRHKGNSCRCHNNRCFLGLLALRWEYAAEYRQ